MERLRNRFAKASLAATMVFGGGGIVEAQSPAPLIEPAAEVIDINPFLNAVRTGLSYDAEPKFFKRMENRAINKPNEFFQVRELPDGQLTLYYPDGLEAQPKVGYRHTVTNGVGNDYNGVEAGLNFFMTDDAIVVDLGKDGTLDGDNGTDLFNFKQIRNKITSYLVEPDILKDVEWVEQGLTTNPASTFKLLQTPEGGAYYGGDQSGFLIVENVVIEVPIIGTDQTPNSKD